MISDKSSVFISWTQGNPRTRDLARNLTIDAEFVNCKGKLPVRYIRQAVATWKLLQKRQPKVILVMLPPFPLILLVAIYAKIKKASILADMHTGAFNDPRWKWSLPATLWLLRGHTTIVTNEFLADQCRNKGIESHVLHDVIEVRETGRYHEKQNTVLCPVSYANDEPIPEILQAARLTPDFNWVMTGKAPASVMQMAPANVTFTGFVADDYFNQLMEEAGAVLALTTRPHTMQRAGYEALSFGTPQVTSNFPELREFLATAAMYTDLTGKDIARSVESVLQDAQALSQEVQLIRRRRIQEQSQQLDSIATAIETARRN